MFLALLKSTLKKVCAEGIFCRRLWKSPFSFLCSSYRPHGSVLGFFKYEILCMTRMCHSLQIASLQNVRFVEAKRLILCFPLYTPLRHSFKILLFRHPKWPQTLFFDADAEIGLFGGFTSFPKSAIRLLFKIFKMRLSSRTKAWFYVSLLRIP